MLIKGRAKSPALAFLHQIALMIPEFVEMLPFLLILHVFGLGNIASEPQMQLVVDMTMCFR